MRNYSLLIVALFFLLKGQNIHSVTSLSSLQLESLIDQVHTMIHTMEKVNSFAKSDLISTLPDVKKMMEVVEKIPL